MSEAGARYTMAQVTDILDCSEEAVVAKIATGELCAVKFGRGWIFPREAFEESLNDAARAETERRRAEHDARSQTRTVITRAKKAPSARRGRVPPVLPAVR